MIYSHCENLWDNNTIVGLGRLPTAYFEAAPDDVAKQTLISQQRLRKKNLGLWINSSLTTYAKLKLRAFRSSYTFNSQDYLSAMLFVVIKMVLTVARSRFSDIKKKLDTMKMPGLSQARIPW